MAEARGVAEIRCREALDMSAMPQLSLSLKADEGRVSLAEGAYGVRVSVIREGKATVFLVPWGNIKALRYA